MNKNTKRESWIKKKTRAIFLCLFMYKDLLSFLDFT